MKNIVTISLIAFIIIVVGILGAGLFFNQKPATQQPLQAKTAGAQSNGVTLTLADLAKHNNSADCWEAVDGKVYNVTSVIPNHPAGADAVAKWCGQDASDAFNTKGGRGPHSDRAHQVLANLYVGDLKK